ncbi:MAG: sigma-54 dependent transcriptional regulator [Candidatus Saganbacteria bacterium]|nr:sigma-54 dependent transcriptional regulator [Candidatus Saganbacteria bacterium]
MSKPRPLIAAVDDEEDILKTINTVLKPTYNVTAFSSPEDALKKIPPLNVDAVLLDIKMPKMDGITFLKKLKKTDPEVPVIILTALSDSRTAVNAMKEGAYDYINKPFDADELKLVIEKALEKRTLEKENRAYREISKESFEDIIGTSEPMRKVFGLIEKIAPSDSTVMITGETGSGKEMVAKAIHRKSNRKNKLFVAVNCAAVPENLFESELFGHERGSFTGALERHIGKFELADGGTIFLDEVGCLPYPMQAKLLRVVQESEVQRIGGSKATKIDIRIICATNADLKDSVKKGTFREDLFFRLNVIPVDVPPIRSRTQDIPLLLEYFLGRFNKRSNKRIKAFTPQAINILKGYYWPGNVRELENAVERLVVLSSKDIIDAGDLSFNIIDKHDIPVQMRLEDAVGHFERDHLTKIFLKAGCIQSKAAKMLGIDRSTLISKLKKYDIC